MLGLPIDLFIGLFLLVAWCWNLPDAYLLKRMIGPLNRTILYLGLWHGWNMFAPEPLMVDRRWEAWLTFADGGRGIWRGTNGSEMSLVAAFLDVRQRKFQDNLVQDSMRFLRPAFCEYLARSFSDSDRRVTRVELFLNQRSVPPIDARWKNSHWERTTIATWERPPNKPFQQEVTHSESRDRDSWAEVASR